MDWHVPFFSRIGEALHDGGLPLVTSRCFLKAISPWVESGTIDFFTRTLGDFTPHCPPAPDIHIRLAGPEDMRLIFAAYESKRTEDKIQKRFREGDRCFIATNDRGESVHAAWFSTGLARVAELNLTLLLEPGEAYTYDVYTRRDMRLRGTDSWFETCNGARKWCINDS